MARTVFISSHGEYELPDIACAVLERAPTRKDGRLDRRYAAYANAVRVVRHCLPKKAKPEVEWSL